MRYSDTLRRIIEDVPSKFKLTNREEEVYEHMVQGLTNREIAEVFGITESGVSSLANKVVEKMNFSGGRAALFLYLLEELDSEVMKAEARIAKELEKRRGSAC